MSRIQGGVERLPGEESWQGTDSLIDSSESILGFERSFVTSKCSKMSNEPCSCGDTMCEGAPEFPLNASSSSNDPGARANPDGMRQAMPQPLQ